MTTAMPAGSSFLAGGGECGARLRAVDWAATPLGAPDGWPLSLKTVLRVMLSSEFAMMIHWGPQMTTFYNDAYAPSLGPRHPAQLGRPAQEGWPDTWDQLTPIHDKVRAGGSYFANSSASLPGYGSSQREAYFTHCHSPLWGDGGDVEGIFLVVTETTREVLAERALEAVNRRQAFELELGDRLRNLSTDGEIVAAATELLGRHLGAARAVCAEAGDDGGDFAVLGEWRAGHLEAMPARGDGGIYGPAIGETLRAGHLFAASDVMTDERTADYGPAFAAHDIRATLVVPLDGERSGQLSAALSLCHTQPHMWTDDEKLLAKSAAERIWAAVLRARAEARLHAEHANSKRAEAALRAADRRKDEFLAMLAHELRNPLAPIRAAADLLSLASLSEARVRQISEVISRQVGHMTSLVDDLLDVSRVTRGLVTLESEVLDAKRIVSDAVEQVRPLIEARRHHLTVFQPPESALVLGDQKRLVQVVTNLLNNAAKYSPEGGQIRLRMEVAGGEVSLAVADDGIGMAPELVERAFELFVQAERSSDRAQGGLGLGLALVRSLVELHHGHVSARSDGPGRGSEFTLRLPRVDSIGGAVLGDSRGDKGPAVRASRRALRLMLVDDNLDAADMLALFLDTIGHSVSVENDPWRALERARDEAPDVCLLDIGLPDMDGNELARRLRAEAATAGAVLIAVTGYGQEQDRKAAIDAGFDHHFVKPVDTGRLAALLAEIGASRS
jgi:signal transduction histidine kinase/CheY-like chemotaxis protein